MNMYNRLAALIDHLIWAILAVVFIFFIFQSEHFLSENNISNIFSAAAVMGVLVVGQTYVLITGNFDLSSESTLGMAALLGIWLIVPAAAPHFGGGLLVNPYLAIFCILLMGAVIGYVIGCLITYGQMNNFIVTLAMLLVIRGLMLAFTEGNAVNGLNNPQADTFYWLGHDTAFIIPGFMKVSYSVLAAGATFLVGHIILKHHRFGRELYAIGGNRDAAVASGINADRRVRQVYAISGILAAIAGWMLAGRVVSIQVSLGEGYIFTVMAAAVIGGISLQGGRGTMLGALGGVLLLSVIDRGLNLMHVSVFWVRVIQGLIILLAMFIDAQRVRIRTLAQTTTVRESKDSVVGR
ncbi:MAG: ABC transporter permease [Aestuariivirga sp.]|jgi:ribose/xylose/arabinose/galactoside ABC-type transport system permease subunit|uniref:ABC transporter permease n=1 Tax=Aestuariivirga sp. TaxID=2650926 RepID=UPI0030197F01